MAVGIDIGGSKILCVYVKDLDVVERRAYKTEHGKVISTLKEIIDCFPNESVGIAVPGYLRGKLCISAPHVPDLNRFDFGKVFPQAAVVNDATAMAYGEYLLRNRKYNTLLLIVIGTGVGCGLIINGKPYTGKGSALELGHIKGFSDIRCGCGKIGCFETIVSGAYIKHIDKMVREAKNGNKKALDFFREYGKRIAKGVACAIQLIDPEIVVFGGGIGQHLELFEESLHRELNELLTFISSADILIEKCISYDSGAIGAAKIAEGDLI